MSAVGKSARKFGILIVGTIVVVIGIILLPLPGPGMLVIILGLVILAQEFEWAQRWLDIAVERSAGVLSAASESKSGRIVMGAIGLGMISLGIFVCFFYTKWIVAGLSFILAGIVSLTTMHPRVRAWIDEKALYGIDGVNDVPARNK